MATTKAKSAKKPAAKKPAAKKKPASKPATTVKAVKVTKKVTTAKAEKVGTAKTKIVSEKKNPVKEFFARKGDPNENILTIFKDTRIIGAIIGEVVGTGLVTAVALTLGLLNPLYMILAYIGITAAVFALSGAHLNPTITVGMMASRRVSAIRGILYIIAQLLGAWLGFMIISGFMNAGIASGNITAEYAALPTLTPASELTAATEGFSFFWPIVMIEFIGAIIIAFFFARALEFKRGAFTFAAVVSSGVFLALLFGILVSGNFFRIPEGSTVAIMNPAAAFMYGVLPSGADGFDSLMGQLWPMLVTYVIFPLIGGVLGFYLSDFANKLSGKELKA